MEYEAITDADSARHHTHPDPKCSLDLVTIAAET